MVELVTVAYTVPKPRFLVEELEGCKAILPSKDIKVVSVICEVAMVILQINMYVVNAIGLVIEAYTVILQTRGHAIDTMKIFIVDSHVPVVDTKSKETRMNAVCVLLWMVDKLNSIL